MNPEKIKNYYEILAIDPLSSLEDIKHAFRLQVALSHPDKVSHLSRDIQAVAFQRTTDLTEAYRILSNQAMRSEYDRRLEQILKVQLPANGSVQSPQREEPPDKIVNDGFLFKTAISRLKAAVQEVLPETQETQVEGFELAFMPRRKWNSLLSSKESAQVLACALPLVDPQTVEDGWTRALKAAGNMKGNIYLFLMGIKLDSPSRLSSGILALQKRRRPQDERRILVVPLNVNSCSALIPNGAPDPLRAIVRALQ